PHSSITMLIWNQHLCDIFWTPRATPGLQVMASGITVTRRLGRDGSRAWTGQPPRLASSGGRIVAGQHPESEARTASADMRRPSRADGTWSLAAGRVGGDGASCRTLHRWSVVRLPLAEGVRDTGDHIEPTTSSSRPKSFL